MQRQDSLQDPMVPKHTSRIFLRRLNIQENIYARLTNALLQIASAVKLGTGFDSGMIFGPVQNRLPYHQRQLTWRDFTNARQDSVPR